MDGPSVKLIDAKGIGVAQLSVWPKFGIGIGIRNRYQILVTVSEPKPLQPKPKLYLLQFSGIGIKIPCTLSKLCVLCNSKVIYFFYQNVGSSRIRIKMLCMYILSLGSPLIYNLELRKNLWFQYHFQVIFPKCLPKITKISALSSNKLPVQKSW